MAAPVPFSAAPPEFCRGTPIACAGSYFEFVASARTCLGVGALDTALVYIEALRIGAQHWPVSLARRARETLCELEEAFAKIALSAAFTQIHHEVA